MSGSWDRPSSGEPDDTWPSEDLRDPATDRPEADRWSGDDPWSRPSSDSASGWGTWPPSASPTEGQLPDDADLPISDPWAEKW
ncbi:MAG: hypothetical protein QOI85_614, partial [Chloroflexota bacterium]|nr:hypothetical protein [Chloroflexota bacterium]